MSMTCLMVFLVVLSTCFLRKYVFDTCEGVRCRNHHRGLSQRWKIPRRNHLMEYCYKGVNAKFLCHFYGIRVLLIALVTYGGPTPGNYYVHDVVTPKGAFGENSWQMHGKTRCSLPVGFLLPYILAAFKKSLRFFWGLILWMLSIGRARHPGPCTSYYPSGFSVAFLRCVGFLEAIWRWSLKPTFWLLLSTVSPLLGLVMYPLSSARLVVLRFGHPLVRMLLLVAMQG